MAWQGHRGSQPRSQLGGRNTTARIGSVRPDSFDIRRVITLTLGCGLFFRSARTRILDGIAKVRWRYFLQATWISILKSKSREADD